MKLYPNSTNIYQPADVCLFRGLKQDWNTTLEGLAFNFEFVKKRQNFPILLQLVVQNHFTPQKVQRAFECCGLCPFNPDALDYSKCLSIKTTTLNENEVYSESDNDDFVSGSSEDNIKGLHPEESNWDTTNQSACADDSGALHGATSHPLSRVSVELGQSNTVECSNSAMHTLSRVEPNFCGSLICHPHSESAGTRADESCSLHGTSSEPLSRVFFPVEQSDKAERQDTDQVTTNIIEFDDVDVNKTLSGEMELSCSSSKSIYLHSESAGEPYANDSGAHYPRKTVLSSNAFSLHGLNNAAESSKGETKSVFFNPNAMNQDLDNNNEVASDTGELKRVSSTQSLNLDQFIKIVPADLIAEFKKPDYESRHEKRLQDVKNEMLLYKLYKCVESQQPVEAPRTKSSLPLPPLNQQKGAQRKKVDTLSFIIGSETYKKSLEALENQKRKQEEQKQQRAQDRKQKIKEKAMIAEKKKKEKELIKSQAAVMKAVEIEKKKEEKDKKEREKKQRKKETVNKKRKCGNSQKEITKKKKEFSQLSENEKVKILENISEELKNDLF